MPLAQDTPGLDWSKYEAEILELFVTRNKTLKEVVKYMKKRHGFVASERQYIYRFPRLKNLIEGEYADIDDECERRAALGKQTIVRLHGHVLPPERVQRGINRVRKHGTKPRTPKRKGKDGGRRISFRTPSPAPLLPPNLAALRIDNLQTSWLAQEFDQVVSSAWPIMDMQLANQNVNGLVGVDLGIAADVGGGAVSTFDGFEANLRAGTHALYASLALPYLEREPNSILISKKANINAPAHSDGGRAPLQVALKGRNAIGAAEILLPHRADVQVPPAKRYDLTALGALCHYLYGIVRKDHRGQQLCHKLRGASATVN